MNYEDTMKFFKDLAEEEIKVSAYYANLKDTVINFFTEAPDNYNCSGAKIISILDIVNIDTLKYVNDTDNCGDSDDTDIDAIMVDDKIFVNEVNFSFLDNTNAKLLNADDIVYPFMDIGIYFDYPTCDKIEFKIRTKNNLGFTRRELLIQILKRYKMIIDVNKHYDLEKNCWTNNEIEKPSLFKTTLGWEYDSTLVSGLCYDKRINKWIVTYNNYI